MSLELKIKKKLGSFKLEIDLFLRNFSSAVFFGPSGSGKTLTLSCLAGLEKPDSGLIAFDGRRLFDSAYHINVPAMRRNMGFMPQDYALFPHLTVLQNTAYPRSGLFARFVSQKEKERARAILNSLGIDHLRKRLPAGLSGGQKQRAALARALNSSPSLLLLDEPFSSLDPLLRERLRVEIKAYLEEFKIPSIIITHDPDDVEAFAERLALFDSGGARLIAGYRDIRKDFPDTASCLRALQRSFQEEADQARTSAVI